MAVQAHALEVGELGAGRLHHVQPVSVHARHALEAQGAVFQFGQGGGQAVEVAGEASGGHDDRLGGDPALGAVGGGPGGADDGSLVDHQAGGGRRRAHLVAVELGQECGRQGLADGDGVESRQATGIGVVGDGPEVDAQGIEPVDELAGARHEVLHPGVLGAGAGEPLPLGQGQVHGVGDAEVGLQLRVDPPQESRPHARPAGCLLTLQSQHAGAGCIGGVEGREAAAACAQDQHIDDVARGRSAARVRSGVAACPGVARGRPGLRAAGAAEGEREEQPEDHGASGALSDGVSPSTTARMKGTNRSRVCTLSWTVL